MKSLDPRVNRLPPIGVVGEIQPKAPIDQFGTFEVFVQPKDGKPFQHEGAVHAPNLEMAFILAKETFTRRFLCTELYVADTRHVYVSPLTEGDQHVYELLPEEKTTEGKEEPFEIYQLVKRGKQHTHLGQVNASTAENAMAVAKKIFPSEKILYNIWAIRTRDIRFTQPDEKDLWLTLPDKKFRDAANYKGGDKLKSFLEKSSS